jgi:hypothetical protein
MSQELVITDLTCALPASGWTAADSNVRRPFSAPSPGKWRIIDYESDHYNGRALQTSCPDAAVLRIPLRRSGWHAVSLGISERGWGQAALDVRLAGDEHWQPLRAVDGSGEGPLHEEPWTFADLTGRDLEVRFPARIWGESPKVAARLFSVRAAPVKPEHVPIVQTYRHQPLVYFNDGIGIFTDDGGDAAAQTHDAPRVLADIAPRAVRAFQDSDWDTCSFACGGADLVNYPSRVGTLFCEGGWDFAYPAVREVQENLKALMAAGVDPLRQAIEQAHAQGHRFWMYQRPQAWAADPQLGHYALSRFYSVHQECRCVEADGRPIWALSIAFEAVRAQLNAILSEALERGADGVTLVLTRGFPLVRYEAPVLARYRELHGGDARKAPADDPRLRSVWSEFVMAWFREVRGLLDAAGPSAQAARRALTVMVGPSREWNLRWGFDVAAWARERLVDAILPFPKEVERTNAIRIADFAEDLRGTGVGLLPCFGSNMDRNTSFAKYRQRAHRYYSAGATGLSCWDTRDYLARLRLDDPELQRLWCEHYLGPQNIEITSIGGIGIANDFGPMLGF